jgi:cell division protein FtsQ
MQLDKAKIWQTTKRIGIICLWVMVGIGVVVSVAFVNKEDAKLKCTSIQIQIEPKHEILFIDRQTVLKQLDPQGDEKRILGKTILQLNTPLVEYKLNHNDFVKKAQVYTDMNGALMITLTQRRPILRIMKADGSSFYLDEDGRQMPTSNMFTSHVPVATGNIFEPYNSRDTMHSFVGSQLTKIATYVDKHAFWKAQIEQIFVTPESELWLIPKLGDHTIVFGTTENMETKFENLLLFYKEGLSRMGWDKYQFINLKYKNQIVCTKK